MSSGARRIKGNRTGTDADTAADARAAIDRQPFCLDRDQPSAYSKHNKALVNRLDDRRPQVVRDSRVLVSVRKQALKAQLPDGDFDEARIPLMYLNDPNQHVHMLTCPPSTAGRTLAAGATMTRSCRFPDDRNVGF
jgi:hypothetical protein